jgi:hypothetical protein
MQPTPWWFAPMLTVVGTILGGAVSIIAALLTQRYALRTQLALKQADAEIVRAAAFQSERERRYLALVQNIEGLFTKAQDASAKKEFLRAGREIWLLGDADLVRKVNDFLKSVAEGQDVEGRTQRFGEIVLELRRSLGTPDDELTSRDFPFYSS